MANDNIIPIPNDNTIPIPDNEWWSSYTLSTTPRFSLAGLSAWARLLDAHDGDTVTVALEVFPGKVFRTQIRLAGIDTPEITSRDPAIKAAAERARVRLLELLGVVTDGIQSDPAATSAIKKRALKDALDARPCLVYLQCQAFDKYGRLLARIAADPHAPHAGDVLVQEGLAKPYDGGTKEAWTAAAPTPEDG